MNKDVLVTANPEYKTASDFPAGCKIATESVDREHDHLGVADQRRSTAARSRRVPTTSGSSPADYQVIPNLLREDEACAGILDPTQVIPDMASGDLTVMYDGKSASQLYGEEIVPGHEGVLSNAFVVPSRMVRREPRRGGLLPGGVGLRDGAVGREPRRDHRYVPAALRGRDRGRGAVHEGLLREHVRLVRREPLPDRGVDRGRASRSSTSCRMPASSRRTRSSLGTK